MQRPHRRLLTALACWALAIVVLAAGRPVAAQQPPSDGAPLLPTAAPQPGAPGSELQVIATPLLALSGINSTISTGLRRAPTVNSSVGAFQLLGHLDGVPVMGQIELRDGPFSLLGNAFHVPVGTDVTTRNVFFAGGNAALVANQGTADLLYHVLDAPVQSLDAGVGFRAWGFATNITLNGRIARTVNLTREAYWADPLIAARYRRDFGNGFGATLYSDVGGFGVGAHIDWEVLGTIDYAWKRWATLRVGYFSLNFDYTAEGGGLGFDVHMKGPILMASFRF